MGEPAGVGSPEGVKEVGVVTGEAMREREEKEKGRVKEVEERSQLPVGWVELTGIRSSSRGSD